MKLDKGTLLGYSMLTVAAIIGGIASFILRGVAFVWLWQWFVTPFGLAPIGFWHALGLSGLIAFLTYELNAQLDDANQSAVLIIKSIMFSLMALFFGYIYHLFM